MVLAGRASNSYVWPIASCESEGAVRRATRKARDTFVLWTTIKIVAALIVLFVLVGIAIPDLVDAHDTALLIVAIAVGFAALAIVVFTVISVRRDYRRLRRGVIHLIEADRQ
jgi:hypothetical protein